MNYFTVNNPKTLKGNASGYVTAILHLSPSDLSGNNVCPMANRIVADENNGKKSNCSHYCLNLSGQGRLQRGGLVTLDHIINGTHTSRVQSARLRKTREFFDNRELFMSNIIAEIASLSRRSNKLAVRLNGTSDIDWTVIKINNRSIFDMFPGVQFYDYTKVPNRFDNMPNNYHLTYSMHDGSNSQAVAAAMLRDGRNVAVVFNVAKNSALPAEYMGYPVIDGDLSDLRFLDHSPAVVGLRAKGYAVKSATNFVKKA